MDYQSLKMLKACDQLQKDIISQHLAYLILPMIKEHHVTRNHKTKWHYHLALYLAHHIVDQWEPPKRG